MIQRKQTLYLLSLLLLSIALMIIPSAKAVFNGKVTDMTLLPFDSEVLSASVAQKIGMIINFLSLLLSIICIFLYLRRNLQLRLSYVLMMLWLGITLIISFLPLFQEEEGLVIQNTNFGTLLGIFGMLGAYMSARLIKKDIELLKSADRIR